MPGGNRMGPEGRGPMTGRAAGYCAGHDVPGYANAYGFGGRGRAVGWGGGFGRGNRHRYWFYATGLPRWMRWGAVAPESAPMQAAAPQEVDALKQEAEGLKQQLQAINERIAALSTTPGATQE